MANVYRDETISHVVFVSGGIIAGKASECVLLGKEALVGAIPWKSCVEAEKRHFNVFKH